MDIDYVVPMVFPQDKEWRKNFKTLGMTYSEHDSEMFVRFRSWGTEELLLRCIRTFMPWVRNIYILLAHESQLRCMPWVDDYLVEKPRGMVKIVYHHEFIPSRFLPTLNSRGIEMFLHRIPGLGDFFLYGNDDMFPLSPLKEEDFFQTVIKSPDKERDVRYRHDGKDNGDILPCQHMHVKYLSDNPTPFQLACLNGLNFVAKEFNQVFTNTLLRIGHTIAPICKSSCLHLWERGGKEIEASMSPVRLNHNFNQYIYTWYQHFTGLYIDHQPPHPYAGVKKGLQRVLECIADPNCGVVCINDNESCSNWLSFAGYVRKEIENKLETYNKSVI